MKAKTRSQSIKMKSKLRTQLLEPLVMSLIASTRKMEERRRNGEGPKDTERRPRFKRSSPFVRALRRPSSLSKQPKSLDYRQGV